MNSDSFLIDTSAWIFALRREPLELIRKRVAYLLEKDAIVTTEIIKLELLGGTKTEKEFNRLKSRLQALETISATITQWEKAYEIAFALRRSGVTVPYTDILIAACALTVGATVLHADIHFDMMAKSLPLKTESYVKTVPFELLR